MRGGGGRLILLELAGGSSYAIAIYPNAHFPRCWFNEYMSEAGRDALGYYHERQDEKRSIGLGPEHDWSSHAADAFGYLTIAYEEPPASSRIRRPPPPRIGTHWSD